MNLPTETKAVTKNGADKPLSVDEELALLQQEEEKAEEKANEAKKLRRLVTARLRKKMRDELAGEDGVDWCIVESAASPIGLKLNGAALYKRYLSAKRGSNDLPSLETMHAFVKPCIFGDAAEVEEIFDKHQAILVVCAGRLVALYEGNKEGAQGK